MTDSMPNRRVGILAVAAVVSILWAILVVPGGRSWTVLVWMAALASLVVSSVVLVLGGRPPTSLATVIRGVGHEKPGRKA